MGKPTEELMFFVVTNVAYLTIDLEGLGHGSGSRYAEHCQMWITSHVFPHRTYHLNRLCQQNFLRIEYTWTGKINQQELPFLLWVILKQYKCNFKSHTYLKVKPTVSVPLFVTVSQIVPFTLLCIIRSHSFILILLLFCMNWYMQC